MNEKLTELAITTIDLAINYFESLSSFFDDPSKAVEFLFLVVFSGIILVAFYILFIRIDKTEKRRDE